VSDHPQKLLAILRSMGAATSAQLQEALGASQATISRALKPLLHSGQVLRVGSGRKQAYVAPRAVEGLGPTESIPMVKVDATGVVTPFASMIPVAGDRFWVDEEDGPAQLHDGLPWFLDDMRPQGFLGLTFARAHETLGLAENPNHWSEIDVLKALCLAGEDQPGNLVVGHESIQRFGALQALDRLPTHEAAYPQRADAALHGSSGVSSAGGDHPKFCAVSGRGPVIVKFSPAGSSPAEQRWRDLLVCEHLALQTLAEDGVPAAASRIVQAAGRVFLEVVRFDRTQLGRVGMVSLLAYDGEYVGKMDNWGNTAERMFTRSLLTQRDADRLRLLEAFGILIGNNDRHYGNISLLIDSAGDWELAPAYDVLPMVYAPVQGELVERPFEPGALHSPAPTIGQWPRALEMALAFWRAVQADGRVSPEFAARAAAHAQALAP